MENSRVRVKVVGIPEGYANRRKNISRFNAKTKENSKRIMIKSARNFSGSI